MTDELFDVTDVLQLDEATRVVLDTRYGGTVETTMHGTFVERDSDVREAEPEGSLMEHGPEDRLKPPAPAFRLRQEARAVASDLEGRLIALTQLEEAGRLHRRLYAEQEAMVWQTFDTDDGLRVHVRSGLGFDPHWKVRRDVGGIPLVAAAVCTSQAWPVGILKPESPAETGIVEWHTMVHVFETADAKAAKVDRLGWSRPGQLPPAYHDLRVERATVEAYGNSVRAILGDLWTAA